MGVGLGVRGRRGVGPAADPGEAGSGRIGAVTASSVGRHPPVPHLLRLGHPRPIQTRSYIAAVLNSVRIRRELAENADSLEQAIASRVDRQRVTVEGDHRFVIVLEEAVLQNPVAGVNTMTAQLGHLLVVSSLLAISLGIIPHGTDRTQTRPVEGFWIYADTQAAVEQRPTDPRRIGRASVLLLRLRAGGGYEIRTRESLSHGPGVLSRRYRWTVTRRKVAGIEVATSLVFCSLNSFSSSAWRSASRPFAAAAANAFMVGP